MMYKPLFTIVMLMMTVVLGQTVLRTQFEKTGQLQGQGDLPADTGHGVVTEVDCARECINQGCDRFALSHTPYTPGGDLRCVLSTNPNDLSPGDWLIYKGNNQ